MTIFTYKKIYKAYLDCKNKKANTVTHCQFFINYEKHLLKLLKELKEREYQVGRFRCFVLTEPVVREVFAGSFRDRIVHHFLLNEIEAYADKYFIYDSMACRKNKGNIFGAKRLQSGIQSSRDLFPEKEVFYLQMDISSFFMSINHQKLYNFIESLIQKIQNRQFKTALWKEEVLYLCRVIIFNDPTVNYVRKGNLDLIQKIRPGKSLFHVKKGYGLPIGNLTSQFFANVYMNEFDQFIKRKLKRKYYYRYVDDFVVLGSRESLGHIELIVRRFLEKRLLLKINNKKTKMARASSGIDFVGYLVRDKYMLPRKRNISKIKYKISKLKIKSKEEIVAFNRSYNSFKGYICHAKNYKSLHSINSLILLKSSGRKLKKSKF